MADSIIEAKQLPVPAWIMDIVDGVDRDLSHVLNPPPFMPVAGHKPTVAHIAGAWLAGLVTADEAMAEIALHPEVLGGHL